MPPMVNSSAWFDAAHVVLMVGRFNQTKSVFEPKSISSDNMPGDSANYIAVAISG